MCLASDAMSASAPFLWPRRPARTKPIDESMQPLRGPGGEYLALGPKCKTRRLCYLENLRIKGLTLDRETWIINMFGSTTDGMLGRSPCLARSRAGAGGHWAYSRSRLLTLEEMLALQGMPADVRRAGISDRQMGFVIGNSMSVGVLERLLVRLLPGMGLLPPGRMPPGGGLQDRWA